MPFCGKCGTENDGSARFCKKCGATLSQAPANESANPRIISKNDTLKADDFVENVTTKKKRQISVKVIIGICAVKIYL